MNLSVRYHSTLPTSASPYRLIAEDGQEVAWANDFLDAQRIRQLSLRSIRAYAYDLLHFARWWLQRGSPPLLEMTESTVVAYVRDQLSQEPQPAPQSINHRLGTFRSWYRFHAGRPLSAGSHQFQRFYQTRSPLGYGRRYRVLSAGLRLKEPKRITVPLSAEQVAKFWASFRTFRDLALIALMLLKRAALPGNPGSQTRRPPSGPSPVLRIGEREQTTPAATGSRNHHGAAKLSPVGTTAHQLTHIIRLSQRPSSRIPNDSRWAPLPVPAPSRAQSGD